MGGCAPDLAITDANLARRAAYSLRGKTWPDRTGAMREFLARPRTRREVTVWGRHQGHAFHEIDDQLSWLENEGFVIRNASGLLVAVAERQGEAAILIGPEGGERVVPVPRIERPLVDPVEARDVG